jgi:hypothetical protein
MVRSTTMTDRQLAICGVILGAVALILAAVSFWSTVISPGDPPNQIYCYQQERDAPETCFSNRRDCDEARERSNSPMISCRRQIRPL